MKDGVKHIVGKRITAVVTARSERDPRNQVFLVFSDGSNFEFYGEHFTCGAGLDSTADIERYVENGGGQVVKVYGDASALEPGGDQGANEQASSLEVLLSRDLAAWVAAKAAVEKARRPSR